MRKPSSPKKLYVVMTRYKAPDNKFFCCAYDKKKDAEDARQYEHLMRWNVCDVEEYQLVKKGKK